MALSAQAQSHLLDWGSMGFLNSLSLSWETFWRMILHNPHSWHNCFVCKPQACGLPCKYLGYHTAPDATTSVFVEPLQLLAGSELHPSKPSMSLFMEVWSRWRCWLCLLVVAAGLWNGGRHICRSSSGQTRWAVTAWKGCPKRLIRETGLLNCNKPGASFYQVESRRSKISKSLIIRSAACSISLAHPPRDEAGSSALKNMGVNSFTTGSTTCNFSASDQPCGCLWTTVSRGTLGAQTPLTRLLATELKGRNGVWQLSSQAGIGDTSALTQLTPAVPWHSN